MPAETSAPTARPCSNTLSHQAVDRGQPRLVDEPHAARHLRLQIDGEAVGALAGLEVQRAARAQVELLGRLDRRRVRGPDQPRLDERAARPRWRASRATTRRAAHPRRPSDPGRGRGRRSRRARRRCARSASSCVARSRPGRRGPPRSPGRSRRRATRARPRRDARRATRFASRADPRRPRRIPPASATSGVTVNPRSHSGYTEPLAELGQARPRRARRGSPGCRRRRQGAAGAVRTRRAPPARCRRSGASNASTNQASSASARSFGDPAPVLPRAGTPSRGRRTAPGAPRRRPSP